MSFLAPFLSQERTLNKAVLKSQKRIFEVLSNLLHCDDGSISRDIIYQQLFNRERIGSTAVGKGIVIPHCRVDNLSITQLSILTLYESIPYDNSVEPVDIFIAIIFPQNIKDIHIKFMSKLVEFIKSDGTIDKIRQSSSNEDLYNVFVHPNNV